MLKCHQKSDSMFDGPMRTNHDLGKVLGKTWFIMVEICMLLELSLFWTNLCLTLQSIGRNTGLLQVFA